MFTPLRKIKDGALLWFWFVLVLSAFGAAYAAYSTLGASGGDQLSAAKWNELVTYTVPPGAVMAFNLTSCPAGWSAADGGGSPARPDLRGQFIRGWNSSTTGIDANRTFGSWQKWSLNVNDDGNGLNGLTTAHGSMSWALWYDPVSLADYPNRWHALVGATAWYNDYYNSYPEYWGITRPTNVALLYCVKN